MTGVCSLIPFFCILVVLCNALASFTINQIHPQFSVITSLAVTCFAARPRNRAKDASWLQSDLIFLFGLLGLLTYTSFSAVPVSNLWDGANHILLTRFIEEHHFPPLPNSMPLHLSWGGDLRGYPWAFHGLLVSLGSFMHVDPIWLVEPALVIFIAASGALLFQMGKSTPLNRVMGSIVLVAGHAPLLVTNSWTLIAAICTALHAAAQLPKHRLFASLFWVATLLIHPIPALLAVGAYLLACFEERGFRGFISLPLFGMSMAAAVSLYPTMHLDAARIFLKDGGRLVGSNFFLPIALIASFLFTTNSAFPSKQKLLLYATLVSLAGGMCAYYSGSTPYWTARFSFVATLMLAGLVWAYHQQKSLLSIGVPCLCTVIFFHNFQYRDLRPEPAFNASILLEKETILGHCTGKNIFVSADPYTASWIEAIFYPTKIRLPEDMLSLTIRCQRHLCQDPLAPWVASHSKADDCVINAASKAPSTLKIREDGRA